MDKVKIHKKMPLGVTGVDAQLLMDVITTEYGNRDENKTLRDVCVENGIHVKEVR